MDINNDEKLELELKKYDIALYGHQNEGVIFVEKDGLYGVVNQSGDVIVPCEFSEYSDAYGEWKEIGFAKKVQSLSEEQLLINKQKEYIKKLHDFLVYQGDIKKIDFHDDQGVNGIEVVKLSDGQNGFAVSTIVYDYEREKSLEIINSNGNHIEYLSEPELFQGRGTPYLVITTDENNLYAASYGNEHSFVVAYEFKTFSKKWKTPMNGTSLQSITINDEHIIVFDINAAKIKYLDKKSGEYLPEKDIDTKKDSESFTVLSQHNLAATNEKLLAGVPGLNIGRGLLQFENEIKLYDNNSGLLINEKTVPITLGTLNAVAIDKKNGNAYVAFDNKIGVFGQDGYEGMLLMSTRNILNLGVDENTGSLMVSMKEGKGKVEIINPSALNTLLSSSKQNYLTGEEPMDSFGITK